MRHRVRMHPRMDTHTHAVAHLTVLDINAHFYLLIQGCSCHQSRPKLHSAADSCFLLGSKNRYQVISDDVPPGPSALIT